MLALPAAPVPQARRSLFLTTGLACAIGAVFFGGLLGVYLGVRDGVLDDLRQQAQTVEGTVVSFTGGDVSFPGVATTTMLLTLLGASIMVQWAVHALRHDARRQSLVALGLTALLGVAFLNAQVFVYQQVELPAGASAFSVVFYTVTGGMLAALFGGLLYTGAALLRTAGGRGSPTDTEFLASHALYWHFLTVAYTAVWFVVYVNK